MELNRLKRLRRWVLALSLAATTGCVAPGDPVPTLWQKLGVPQAGARLRDGLVNRRGNFPGLEKKPPVLALADPANLDPAKPDMIKAAAEIKQDQDLKKQKIKAIKFLADVNCGCYNKDDKVEAAFLAALEDCDPDVRMAALEGLCQTADNCAKCNSCVTTCCTKALLEKLEDLATGVEDGCFKEPVKEIREMAQSVYCACPPLAEEPIEPEELIAPEPEKIPVKKRRIEGKTPEEQEAESEDVAFQMSDSRFTDYPGVVVGATHLTAAADIPGTFRLNDTTPGPVEIHVSKLPAHLSSSKPRRSTSQADVALSTETASETVGNNRITNPDQLITVNTVAYRTTLGELLVEMPLAFELAAGWTAIVVDSNGDHSLAKIIDVGGRRVLLAVDKPWDVQPEPGKSVRIGLVSK